MVKGDIEKLEALVKSKKLSDAELRAVMDTIKNPVSNGENRVKHHWSGRKVRIGLGGDVHIGSKYADISMINDVFKRFKREGVDAVYLTGDITEGYNRRKGHSLECDLHGADEQVKGVVEKLPSINKPIYFITGDHDDWHYQSAGVSVGKAIDMKRSDMHFLGAFNSTVELFKNTTLMLQHPAKGTAYAISYQIQKMIEAFTGGEKPDVLAVGHYHKIEYLFYRNVHAFQTGTMQRQTPWMKRMNLSAHQGAWILDVYSKRNGSIDKVCMKMFPYY